jgi:hypothetical protein
MEALAAVLLAALALRGPRPRRSLRWRVLSGIALAPLALLVLLALVVGVAGATVPPNQSTALAGRLHAAGAPATLILVAGAGHDGFTGPGQHPSPDRLTSTIADFFVSTLGPGSEP